MFQLKIPFLVTTNTAGNVQKPHQKKSRCVTPNMTADVLTSCERRSSFSPTNKSSRALLTSNIYCGVTFTNVETQTRTAVTCMAACNSTTIPSTSLCGGHLAQSIRISLRYVMRTSLNVTANIILWQLGLCLTTYETFL